MGPTGAGKSTVLKTIYKDILLKEGSLYIDGQDITYMRTRKIPYYRRKIGMIFQDFQLIGDRSVFENIALPLHILGLANKEIRLKVNGILEKVGLESVKKMFPSQLSGGEQQMVAIGRALMSNPEMLLCDELSLGLAPIIIRDIYDVITTIKAEGISLLVVEQDISQALAIADRVFCLQEGHISLSGKPGELTKDQIAAAYFGR